MPRALSIPLWLAVAALAGVAFAVMALSRGESVNAGWLVVAALCSYAVGYRFYARFIARRVFALDDARPTPAVRRDDGHDYVPTSKWVVFGHHFSAIAGAGPLVGPVLAAQFGFLPGTIWIIVGVVLGGAVQDLVVLCASMRRDGKSLAQMAREEVNPLAGAIALFSIVGIILILIAFLALVVVNIMAKSPWATVTIGATIPIALLMGAWMRWLRPGRVLEASAIGVALLIAALFAGQWVADHEIARAFTFEKATLGWAIIVYGFLAAVLPVWLLLAPRDYLSAFVKVGVIALLAVGVLVAHPPLLMPAIPPPFRAGGAWVDGTGPVYAGRLFPFCFIVIACGAISGFHALVSSGTTPKLIARESHAPPIGYGAMLLESFVAVMAMIAACSLHPGVYFAMNAGGVTGIAGDLGAVAAKVNGWIAGWGGSITPDDLRRVADDVGEKTIVARAGGAPTLAVGMARILSGLFGHGATALWYHFATMFEALFILTTVDAGTRVGRFLVQEIAGRAWKPLGEVGSLPGMILGSLVVVAGWGWFLLAAIADPNGGVQALVPLFGVSNQLLAAVALAVATVILVKMGRRRYAFVTALPLAWLLVVTETAGWQLIWTQRAAALDAARSATLRFNSGLCAALCAIFMAVIVVIVALAAWECFLIATGRKAVVTSSTTPPAPQPGEAELREA